MQDNRYQLNKRLLQSAFNRAARGYDDAALLQREVGMRMLERLDLMRLNPALIVDAGAGTGLHTRALARRYKNATVLALDISVDMLREAQRQTVFWHRWFDRRRPFVCGDIDALPLRAASVDMIFSNLTLQWCNDLDRTLGELRRALKPGGLLMFSTFGPDTLKELRASWAHVDERNHVNAFLDMHDIGDALVRARFVSPVMDVERYTLTYPDVYALMRDLKAIGAHNVTAGRAHGLTGKGRLHTLSVAYEGWRQDGVLPASYEVVYGHAWVAEDDVAQQSSDGTIRIPLASLRGRKES
ncbi:MAG: malonyl-ACP O-methyltransferase BioC [Gammaproteobacteria bacterium]|nr:malonyl-ACP O-methyltransferase BioC [Gammaproteobacteria bacterium]